MPAEHQRPPSGAVPPPPPPPPPPSTPQPPSATWRADDEPTAGDRRQADLRIQVAYRLKRANSDHLLHADQAYGRRGALSPNGLLLFFTAPAEAQPHGYKLYTASRTFPESPDSDDLPLLLRALTEVAADNVAVFGRTWNPLGTQGCMVNGGDRVLPAGAEYVGVGVSTLDSDRGRWYQIADTVRAAAAAGRYMSTLNIKGQCYAVLTDGTAMHVVRDPEARVGDSGIRCNKTTDPERLSYRYHNPWANITEQGDDETRAVWRQLVALHNTLAAHLLAGRPA
ncbi:hypothetical protein ABZ671_16955 [Micromonospora sp. NPDC006766]|uniref:hypothetical protein n=1 Tax=Micromonospora sp. NPDC006766 TaxID=3154778 RepID=UPI0033CBDDEF